MNTTGSFLSKAIAASSASIVLLALGANEARADDTAPLARRTVEPPTVVEREPEPEVEMKSPGSPGLLAGGIVLLTCGVGTLVGDGLLIYASLTTADGPGAALGLVLGIPIGIIGLGATAGGIAMTVIGAKPKAVHGPRRDASTTPPPPSPTLSFDVGPNGVFLRGTF